MSILTGRLAKVVPFDWLAVYVPRRGSLTAVHTAGTQNAALASLSIPLGQGVSGWVAAANRAILNGNPAVKLCYAAAPSNAAPLGSALALPLPGPTGPVGVLALYGSAENAFDSDDLKLLAGFTPQLANYIESSAENGCQFTPELPFELFHAPASGASLLIQ